MENRIIITIFKIKLLTVYGGYAEYFDPRDVKN
jgi:hypothetical protein